MSSIKARDLIATPLQDIIMPQTDGEDMTPAKPVLDGTMIFNKTALVPGG
jgi:hypothetical protein